MNYIKNAKQLIYRILLLIVLYQVCRVGFYYLNKSLFNDIGLYEFIGGFRFDLSAIFFSNCLFIILSAIPGSYKYTDSYQKFLKILFFVTNAFFIATNFIDMEYYKFTNKRSTFSLITASGMEKDIARLIPVFFKQYWFLFFGFIITLYLFWKAIPSFSFKNVKDYKKSTFIISITGMLCATASIIILGRGGLQKAPIKTVDAINYTHNPKNTAVVLNTPFTIFKTISKKDNLRKVKYFENKVVNSIYNPTIKLVSDSIFKKKNIVILILESFGKENINLTFEGRKLTPFLDSLINESRFYNNAFANGSKSIDAVPSTITSIPCLMEISYISSPYSFNKLEGFSNILKKEGYSTAFFHGAFNGSQNFNEFAQISNYDKYYGKDEYVGEEAYDGTWGIFDEDFLQFMVNELNTFKEPFFSTLFTVSSHNPYTIPKKYEGKFSKGDRIIHESISYTDYALKRFFETAKQQSWYNNTLFIITPDHVSYGDKKGFFNTSLGNYSIPILFFDPSNPDFKGLEDKLFEQIDILPESLSYLDYSGEIFSFGNEMNKKERIVANYNEGIYRFIFNDYFIHFNGEKIIDIYKYKEDSLLQNKLTNYPDDSLKRQMRAYIQQYNNRLIDNTLTVSR